MARVRSPNYPAISLSDAIRRAAQVFAKETKHLTPKDVIAEDMGYSGVNGASLTAISAVQKYGLIEREGEDYRVTDRLLAVLHPRTPQEKSEAIITAANEPALFAELNKQFEGALPSDDNLRAYLIRRGFNQGALTDVISSYRETIEFVKNEIGGYDTPPGDDEVPPPPFKGAGAMQANATVFRRASGGEPFRVSFTGKGIEVAGRLDTPADADELISAVAALKLLLKPLDEVKR